MATEFTGRSALSICWGALASRGSCSGRSSGSSETFNSSFQVPSSSILRLFFSSVFYFHIFDCRREGCCFHFDPLSVAAVLEGRMNSNSRVL
ncbi:hypothetical protein SDJN03_26959, partial [Cucurbita argyrosperma subsp. sororia]